MNVGTSPNGSRTGWTDGETGKPALNATARCAAAAGGRGRRARLAAPSTEFALRASESTGVAVGVAARSPRGRSAAVASWLRRRRASVGTCPRTCVRRRHNGTRTNTLHLPVTTVNEAVLHAIEAHVFTPPAIEQMVSLTGRDDH